VDCFGRKIRTWSGIGGEMVRCCGRAPTICGICATFPHTENGDKGIDALYPTAWGAWGDATLADFEVGGYR